jgi:prepilin signal peptidase PulO-like enzyme (type II secretory pathway)
MPDILTNLSHALPGMPLASWWLVPAVLFLLGVLAVVDAITSKVPDPVILPSLLLITAVDGYYVDWPFAGVNLLIALGTGFGIFLLNEIWFRTTKRDALGMGDAKWTMIAVQAFGIQVSLIAWAVGAILAIIWMGGARIIKFPIARVHFAPFLFIGVLAGIWYLRLK